MQLALKKRQQVDPREIREEIARLSRDYKAITEGGGNFMKPIPVARMGVIIDAMTIAESVGGKSEI